MQEQNIYVAIDLKSFYASVECQERGLNPLTTNLVVADSSRTEKTICLAVSPSLKQYGIPGRARLFEVVQKVREINTNRKYNAPGHILNGKSYEDIELKKHPEYELDYIIAPPQMKKYMKYSTNIYNVYLKYFSPDDICVYSIDEVFIDVTHYLKTYQMKASQLATKVIHDIYKQTGITATCGVGTNLYLAKIAMDIVAKHATANKYGVRIACLDEEMYKKQLWNHKPLTDFWTAPMSTLLICSSSCVVNFTVNLLRRLIERLPLFGGETQQASTTGMLACCLTPPWDTLSRGLL